MPKKKKEEMPEMETLASIYDENKVEEFIPEPETTQPTKYLVFIPSSKVAYAAVTEKGVTKKFLEGSVNGRKYKVMCDTQQEVDETTYEALKPLLSKLGK